MHAFLSDMPNIPIYLMILLICECKKMYQVNKQILHYPIYSLIVLATEKMFRLILQLFLKVYQYFERAKYQQLYDIKILQ